MSSSAHIYNPQDDSLEARIHAYKTMRNELLNIEASQKLSQTKGWQDRLGTEDELKQAHNVIKNSLRMALDNIRDVDLQKAQEQHLMTAKEVSEFSAVKQIFGKSFEQDKERIDQNKAEIKKARERSMNRERDRDYDR